MAQTVDRELNNYISMLNLSQKKSILAVIKTFLQPAEPTERISREQYNIEIKEAEERVKSGRFITMEELEKDAEKW